MTVLPPDPLESGGIAEYGKRLRAGDIMAEASTVAYLDRIEALDPKLGAYEYVAGEQALKAARALDSLLAAGTDLGPLMGVPVAIKDLFAVEGMTTHAGSNLDLSDVIGVEGSFVKRLKRAGCVILGKTKTVEFALGTTGISKPRGTPWNPWDAKVHRVPGGSSSGSGVAAAASLCGFAISTDTGGSVRLPASFCGVFGLKTTVGLWPTDGVFPLPPDLDRIAAAIELRAVLARPIVGGLVMPVLEREFACFLRVKIPCPGGPAIVLGQAEDCRQAGIEALVDDRAAQLQKTDRRRLGDAAAPAGVEDAHQAIGEAGCVRQEGVQVIIDRQVTGFAVDLDPPDTALDPLPTVDLGDRADQFQGRLFGVDAIRIETNRAAGKRADLGPYTLANRPTLGGIDSLCTTAALFLPVSAQPLVGELDKALDGRLFERVGEAGVA